MLKLSCPGDVKLVVKSVGGAINALTPGVTDRYALLVVVDSIEDAHRIVSACPAIKELDMGGCRESAQTTRRLYATTPVTDQDVDLLCDLIAKGVEIEIRQVPSDRKIRVADLI